MCNYCSKNNVRKDAEDGDCIVYSEKEKRYYLLAEHCRNEVIRIEVEYCPQCGQKLN